MRTSVWTAVVCSTTRRVLIAKRARTANNPRRWNFFGGGLGARERPIATAIRELMEEGSIAAVATDLIPLNQATFGGKRNVLFGLAVPTEVIPVLNAEHDAFRWVPLDDLPSMDNLHGPTWRFASEVRHWAATLARHAAVSVEVAETGPTQAMPGGDEPIAAEETAPASAPPTPKGWLIRAVTALIRRPSAVGKRPDQAR